MINYFDVFLLLIVLSIIWGFARLAHHRRLVFGFVGILVSGLLFGESIINNADLNIGWSLLLLLPAIGGITLILVSFLPKLQNGFVEYLGWAIWFGLFGVVLFRGTGLRGQWFFAILLMAMILIVQKLEDRPVDQWGKLIR